MSTVLVPPNQEDLDRAWSALADVLAIEQSRRFVAASTPGERARELTSATAPEPIPLAMSQLTSATLEAPGSS